MRWAKLYGLFSDSGTETESDSLLKQFQSGADTQSKALPAHAHEVRVSPFAFRIAGRPNSGRKSSLSIFGFVGEKKIHKNSCNCKISPKSRRGQPMLEI